MPTTAFNEDESTLGIQACHPRAGPPTATPTCLHSNVRNNPSPPAPHSVLMIGNDELDVISEGGDQITTSLEGIASLASYMQKVKVYNIMTSRPRHPDPIVLCTISPVSSDRRLSV